MRLTYLIIILSFMAAGAFFIGSHYWPSTPPEFPSLIVKGQGTLHLLPRKDYKIEGAEATNEKGILVVQLKENANAFLYLKSFNFLTVEGDAVVRNDEEFTIKDLTLIAGGKANVRLALKGKFVNVAIQDHAQVMLSGVVDEQRVLIADEGRYEAAGLFSERATVDVSGHAKGIVNTYLELTADVSENGTLEYGGDPGTIKKNVSDNGVLRSLK